MQVDLGSSVATNQVVLKLPTTNWGARIQTPHRPRATWPSLNPPARSGSPGPRPTDNVGVTGYDGYATGQLRTSLAGTVLTYTDDQPASASISHFIRPKDAAGNQSAKSNTVTRNGSSGARQQPGARQADHRVRVRAHLCRDQGHRPRRTGKAKPTRPR
ncbi:hypothetical protein AB0F43_37185 [Kribbella sp. NPDC023972]|uniref:hypothetical protein n=1 Tax=Kribbella sp. NPDC023972 TaxID=3154795 RepID=UPI0033E38A2F